MNDLEAEYSFLAPTWKLPPVGSTSTFPSIIERSYSPPPPKISSDPFTWYYPPSNTRYAPLSSNRANHSLTIVNHQPEKRSIPPPPIQANQHPKDQFQNNENSDDNIDFSMINNSHDDYNVPSSSRSNGYQNQNMENRTTNYPPPPPPPPIQKRVQIIDHNRQTPSTDHISARESHSSSPHENSSPSPNHSPQKIAQRRNHTDDNKSDTTNSSYPRLNNFNIHEYLYGLAQPDPGSYVSAYKNQRRRVQDGKQAQKAVLAEYKNFVQNGGFGPMFGSGDYRTYEEKLETEKKRKSYSKFVNAANQYKIEEQKRIHNNGGVQRSPGYAAPKQRTVRYSDARRPNFISADEVRDFERRIKREHDANCKCSLHAKHN